VRKVTAVRLSELRTIPHFYLSVELNVALLVALRQELSPSLEAQPGIRLTHTDLLLRALALNLPRHPLLNAAYYNETEIKVYDEINPGVAIATEQGLVVGVIRHADRMSLGEIAAARHSLAAKAQERRLTPQDITGGTFTLTNLGMYGVDDFSPIVNPGQSAILAVGAIRERPVGEDGKLVLRPTLHMTLAVDHRVADGTAGALFLKELGAVLEAPDALRD
jgi:pyruvate dehydrogenase E2 component (dihydrolipoamide acetyltransferase)